MLQPQMKMDKRSGRTTCAIPVPAGIGAAYAKDAATEQSKEPMISPGEAMVWVAVAVNTNSGGVVQDPHILSYNLDRSELNRSLNGRMSDVAIYLLALPGDWNKDEQCALGWVVRTLHAEGIHDWLEKVRMLPRSSNHHELLHLMAMKDIPRFKEVGNVAWMGSPLSLVFLGDEGRVELEPLQEAPEGLAFPEIAAPSAPIDETEMVGFGKHKGKQFSELPANYLQWMVDNNHRQQAKAVQELAKRQAAPAT